jgi:transposase
MIPVAAGVRIWIATGHTDMRKGMQGLALLVQEGLGRDPFAGDVFVFRGRGGSLIKAVWHDGIGLSLYAKRLDRGRFVWPVTVDGVVALEDTLEMSEQHLDLLPAMTRTLVGRCGCQTSSDIARVFVKVTWHFTLRCVRAALRLEGAALAVRLAGPI